MTRTRTRSLRSIVFRTSSPPERSTSPTFSETSHASGMGFGENGPEKIITRANLRASLQAYDDLMTMTANYRAALHAMALATDAFARALETCASLKGPTYEASTRLQAASGLHYLIGNNWQFMSETLDRNFEKPLRTHLEGYRTIVNERSAAYERALHEKSQAIRRTEMGNMNKKERNLQSFREALSILQRQVDDLDDLKVAHYQEIMDHEVEVWDVVQNKVCLAVRSTMEVFDKFTTKSSDPILESMLQSVPDPFDAYRSPQPEGEDQIFSILPPLSIMANTPSASPSPHITHSTELLPPAFASSSPTPNRHASWPGPGLTGSTGAARGNTLGFFDSGATEWADVQSRSPSPPSAIGSPSSPSPSNISPRSSSPPSQSGASSPLGTNSRKFPTVGHHHLRRADSSKMRNVLSVIDESAANRQQQQQQQSQPQQQSSSSQSQSQTPQFQPQSQGRQNRLSPQLISNTISSSSSSIATSSVTAGWNGMNDLPWSTLSTADAESPLEVVVNGRREDEGEKTPRHSTFFDRDDEQDRMSSDEDRDSPSSTKEDKSARIAVAG